MVCILVCVLVFVCVFVCVLVLGRCGVEFVVVEHPVLGGGFPVLHGCFSADLPSDAGEVVEEF